MIICQPLKEMIWSDLHMCWAIWNGEWDDQAMFVCRDGQLRPSSLTQEVMQSAYFKDKAEAIELCKKLNLNFEVKENVDG